MVWIPIGSPYVKLRGCHGSSNLNRCSLKPVKRMTCFYKVGVYEPIVINGVKLYISPINGRKWLGKVILYLFGDLFFRCFFPDLIPWGLSPFLRHHLVEICLCCFVQPPRSRKSKKDDMFLGDEMYFTRWCSDNEGYFRNHKRITIIPIQNMPLHGVSRYQTLREIPQDRSPCCWWFSNWSLTFHEIISVGGSLPNRSYQMLRDSSLWS